MSQANIELVQAVYAAFGRGDVEFIIGALADDVSWAVNGREGDYPTFGVKRGKAGVTAFFAYIGANENFSDFSPQGFFSDADRVFVEGHAAYTVTGTGKSVDTNFLHVFTITGGKITGFVEYFDTYQVVLAGR
ncbi:MAG: nuclear transport factor 2 family protein [Caulobacteraceae bacterium]